ncbi:MAG: A24 family peptidase [Pseudomonadales bacterium]
MSELLAYGWQGLVLAAWVGLAVGSFLNVVIYRYPVMLERDWRRQAREILELSAEPETEKFNLSVPRSRCPHCDHQIRWFENIPVLSWLVLRARCTGCKQPISARYPAIELLTGLLTLAVLATFGFTWLGLAAALFTWLIVALTFIDYDTKLLPDQLTLPLLWLGLIVNFNHGIVPLTDALLGAVCGYLFLWSTFWAFKLVTGKEGMGYGDFKLFAALGAWLGWQALPSIILLSACGGLIYALALILLRKQSRQDTIPFGPFLAAAGWVTLVFRDNVLAIFLLA